MVNERLDDLLTNLLGYWFSPSLGMLVKILARDWLSSPWT